MLSEKPPFATCGNLTLIRKKSNRSQRSGELLLTTFSAFMATFLRGNQ
jgi:hypothetical protein